MKTWATISAFREEIADVPLAWLDAFILAHPTDTRQFAEKNAKTLLRVEAVLAAIERGEIRKGARLVVPTVETFDATATATKTGVMK